MNFPGLDRTWRAAHRAAHAMGLMRTWSLPEAADRLARGEKVLVVATTALGDSLLTTPLLSTLSDRLGADRVSLLVRGPYVDLYQDDPRLHRVFAVRGKYRWEKLRGKLRADRHRIALMANMTEPDLIPYLHWSGVRGFLRYRTRWTTYPEWIANSAMLRRPGDSDYATGHAIENNLAMAEALGIEPTTHRLALPHIRGNKKYRLVFIHPGASRQNKRWNVDNWARLADAIMARFDVIVLISGDAAEKRLCHTMRGTMRLGDYAKVVAGKFSLHELAHAQSEAMVFLSGDTGPYHLALAVGCPTVTLFAPTDRGSSMEACGPHQADPEIHRAIQTRKPGDSITTISYDRVWTEVEALLGSLSQQASFTLPTEDV